MISSVSYNFTIIFLKIKKIVDFNQVHAASFYRGSTGNYMLSRHPSHAYSANNKNRMSMAEGLVDESSLKKGLFKDVRFFLADESNEKVRG